LRGGGGREIMRFFSNHFSEVSWSRPKLDGVEFPLYRRAIIAFFVVFGRGD
jgi:hypothetical protein